MPLVHTVMIIFVILEKHVLSLAEMWRLTAETLNYCDERIGYHNTPIFHQALQVTVNEYVVNKVYDDINGRKILFFILQIISCGICNNTKCVLHNQWCSDEMWLKPRSSNVDKNKNDDSWKPKRPRGGEEEDEDRSSSAQEEKFEQAARLQRNIQSKLYKSLTLPLML